jgi:hypothetical protein
MSKATQVNKEAKMIKLAELLATVRIDEGEKNTLKTVFSEDPFVYKTLRDLLFGFELDEGQKNIVGNFRIIKKLLRKIFIPELDKTIPIGKNYDLWQTQDIKTATDQNFETIYEAKEHLIGLLEKGFKRLDSPDENEIDLAAKRNFPFLIARNNFITYVDSQIRFLIQFVNMDSLTAEERMKMMQMNSTE